MTINITILGATGSIGKSTLDIVRQQPDRFKIVGLTTNTNIIKFEKLLREFKPRKAVVANTNYFKNLPAIDGIEIISGKNGLI